MVVEVMGRYAGWIALFAGVAGGADVILIPEIPFRYESIGAKIEERERKGKHFTLVIAAEGARERDGEFVVSAGQEANCEARLGGIGAVDLIAAGRSGRMVGWQGAQIGDVSLSEAVGRLKTVPIDGNLACTARALGISLED